MIFNAHWKRTGLLFFASILIAFSTQAQQLHPLMKSLGFRRSGHEYLYTLTTFRYACDAKQYRPYLAIGDTTLQLLDAMPPDQQLAYLLGDSLAWRIILPSQSADTNKAQVLMKGRTVADSREFKRLSFCNSITVRGKAPMSDPSQQQQLIDEALLTWDELVSWYRTGK